MSLAIRLRDTFTPCSRSASAIRAPVARDYHNDLGSEHALAGYGSPTVPGFVGECRRDAYASNSSRYCSPSILYTSSRREIDEHFPL
ncbi:hypothetical protein G8759_14300 [Spirosoma aureum]|uniref:Uncharacterized protein n=1 Tax=Spirosoma aureum TaxID=2692134 RepID=A0A6G9AFA3_9BACT|nr:hypothetical protein [Spirosoma aureum]QIP11137.1 hypothetical protein G8759_14300 [Spirosoma aureum]